MPQLRGGRMSGEVCEHCGAHYWLRNEDGRFCGQCGLSPFNPPSLRDLLRDAIEHGDDPIGNAFDHVGRVMLWTIAAIVAGAAVGVALAVLL
jgi:hypothetical protein